MSDGKNMNIKLVDKVATDRFGTVVQGHSEIYFYIEENDPADHVGYFHGNLTEIVHDHFVFEVARHVEDSVFSLEEWGHPIWEQSGNEVPLVTPNPESHV